MKLDNQVPAAAPPNLAKGVTRDTDGPMGGRTRTRGARPGWSGRGIPPPPKPAATPAPAAVPPPVPPKAEEHLAKAETSDAVKYGPRAAGVLRRAGGAVLRLFLKALGATGGAAIGAAAGFGLSMGNPLGALAGGLAGGVLGGNSLTLPRRLATPTRAAATVRRAEREVAPRLAGAVAAAPVLGAGILAGAGGGLTGAMAGLTLGGGAAAVGQAATHAVRRAMASSAVRKRRAARDNREKVFAENFADDGLPPNAVAILKARLRVAAQKAGLKLGEIPDAVVASALKMAAQDADVAAMSECLREARKAARSIRKLAGVRP